MNEMVAKNAEAIKSASEVMSTGMSYTDLDLSNMAVAKDFYNAVSQPDTSLKECVNIPIAMTHVSVEVCELHSEQNGDVIAPRVVIMDKDGKSYQAVSIGVYQSLKRIFALFGTPDTWTEPLTVVPMLTSTKKGQVLSLRLE